MREAANREELVARVTAATGKRSWSGRDEVRLTFLAARASSGWWPTAGTGSLEVAHGEGRQPALALLGGSWMRPCPGRVAGARLGLVVPEGG
ncbi:hypothetical protein ETD83_26450 [Actinomadura soli]|uniref:Uncharacterized protein n=1 Tax=Actinomadura soli TaxID=2508997 RepID=A0A5C4J5X0_9ACTN|nr:hypothetical protein ETD83_26450 [Actinomadura soli]